MQTQRQTSQPQPKHDGSFPQGAGAPHPSAQVSDVIMAALLGASGTSDRYGNSPGGESLEPIARQMQQIAPFKQIVAEVEKDSIAPLVHSRLMAEGRLAHSRPSSVQLLDHDTEA